ncbi:MAG TPA: type I methionyl aminopeptidase [Dehalococcoidales bacterium]|nr:type I methionyl aminopeptidase [Dehalococcoidales bacterium]
MGIIIKSEKEIAVMRQAGKIVAEVLRIVSRQVKPGMKTRELDIIAERELKKRGARSSFKGYRGFPANLCVSVNDEIVHGIPGDRVLKNGDVVSLDFGVIYEGFQGDAAVTVPVGEASPEARRLIATTREALESGIAAARAGAALGDVSAAIQDYAEARGYSVVREYTGHGIGREMHEEPQIPNCTEPPYGLKPGMGPVLKKGMTLALEPMLNTGDWHTRVATDRWTVLTADGGLSAHFEHTIAIDDTEPEVLTRGVYA